MSPALCEEGAPSKACAVSFLGKTPPRSAQAADLVLGADCVCCVADAEALAATLARCVRRPHGEAIVALAAQKHRFGVERFASACAERGLRVETEQLVPLAKETPLLETASGWALGMAFDVHRIKWPSTTPLP